MGMASARRRSLSPGWVLRHGIVSAQRFSITCGSSRGGREIKSGATGNSSSGAGADWLPPSVGGVGAADFFIQVQVAIFQEQFTNVFRAQVELVNSNQAFDVLKIFEETVSARVL